MSQPVIIIGPDTRTGVPAGNVPGPPGEGGAPADPPAERALRILDAAASVQTSPSGDQAETATSPNPGSASRGRGLAGRALRFLLAASAGLTLALAQALFRLIVRFPRHSLAAGASIVILGAIVYTQRAENKAPPTNRISASNTANKPTAPGEKKPASSKAADQKTAERPRSRTDTTVLVGPPAGPLPPSQKQAGAADGVAHAANPPAGKVDLPLANRTKTQPDSAFGPVQEPASGPEITPEAAPTVTKAKGTTPASPASEPAPLPQSSLAGSGGVAQDSPKAAPAPAAALPEAAPVPATTLLDTAPVPLPALVERDRQSSDVASLPPAPGPPFLQPGPARAAAPEVPAPAPATTTTKQPANQSTNPPPAPLSHPVVHAAGAGPAAEQDNSPLMPPLERGRESPGPTPKPAQAPTINRGEESDSTAKIKAADTPSPSLKHDADTKQDAPTTGPEVPKNRIIPGAETAPRSPAPGVLPPSMSEDQAGSMPSGSSDPPSPPLSRGEAPESAPAPPADRGIHSETSGAPAPPPPPRKPPDSQTADNEPIRADSTSPRIEDLAMAGWVSIPNTSKLTLTGGEKLDLAERGGDDPAPAPTSRAERRSHIDKRMGFEIDPGPRPRGDTTGAPDGLRTTAAGRRGGDADTAKAPASDSPRVDAVLHVVESGENFWTISGLYYGSSRYYRALWKANAKECPQIDGLHVNDVIKIPPAEDLDPAYIGSPRSRKSTARTGGSPSRDHSASARLDDGATGSLGGIASAPARSGLSATQRGSRSSSSDEVNVAQRTSRRDEELDLPATKTAVVSRRERSGEHLDRQADLVEEEDETPPRRRVVARASQSNSADDLLPPSRPVYKVRPYETLRSIARDTLGDPRRAGEIAELNRNIIDDPSHLIVGQVIELPEDARTPIRRFDNRRE